MPRTFTAEFIRRILAGGLAAMLLALTFAAVSPVLHDQLHHGDHGGADDRCAVVLFASATDIPLAAVTLPPPATLQAERDAATWAEIFLTSPRYLHQPECGPPALG